jgi:lipopolysaccharide export system permease protein
MMGMLTTLDRFIAVRFAKPFLASIAIVILLLSLENAARLMDLLEGVERPVSLLFKFMFYLIPEYLGVGLLFAVFIATALCFRSLAVSGELDIFWSVGMSPARALRVPLLIGMAVAILHIGLRGYVQPYGERQLDALGYAAGSGELGVAIKENTFYRPSPRTTLLVDHVDREKKIFSGVFVQTRNLSVIAHHATAKNGGKEGILLTLHNGHITHQKGNGRFAVVEFGKLELPLNTKETARPRETARHRNDRVVLHGLIERLASGNDKRDTNALLASLGTRFMMATAILILPLLAFLLGVPPKRTTTAFGMGLGILLIVCFIQMVVAIEDSGTQFGLMHQVAVLTGLAAIILRMLRYQNLNGLGAIEDKLDHVVKQAWHLVARNGLRISRSTLSCSAAKRPCLRRQPPVALSSSNARAVPTATQNHQQMERNVLQSISKLSMRGLPIWWKLLILASRNCQK